VNEPVRRTKLEARIRFVNLLAQRLHEYGTSAPRLESAIDNVAARLGLDCHSLSTPTSIILSYTDHADEDTLSDHTQVLRLEPGELDLKRLAQVDAIAEQVAAGALGIVEGYRALRELHAQPRRLLLRVTPAAYGLSSASVAALFRGSWLDVATAGAIGALIGLMAIAKGSRPQLAAGFEAVAALVAGFLVVLVHQHAPTLSINQVLVSGLIVLLPGLMLTTAVNELATNHLVSGVARLAQASTVLLKLGFGSLVAMQLGRTLGYDFGEAAGAPVPRWTEWLALLSGSFAFAILFRAARADYPLVMASAWLGFVATRLGGTLAGAEFGVFFAAFVVSAVANAYGRIRSRPGALVRVPGIILLVPGSIGFRSVFSAFERDIQSGLETAITMIVLLVSLVAGLLFGNLVVPPRRTLS
jgi:uncharacterized membrane protein YjjP (DUF1212 family)